jgi:3'-phosphoadenosine 5'-phosphosulfate sulfotransferase (PAPS reductase)/FAD synthetase
MHNYDDKVIVPVLGAQLGKPGSDKSDAGTYFNADDIDLSIYDYIVLAFSGGKDSWACLLHLIELGVDMRRVELWHHDVDGREGSGLMDWVFMADYIRLVAKKFGLPIYFSWLEGGFEGEMLKNNGYGRPHHVETPGGLLVLNRDTKRGKPRTRLKFPQVSANLQTRWCSSALKIDVARRAINNQDRFNSSKTLFITGERRQESSNRAKYNQLEPHACDRRKGRLERHVDTWRPVLNWSEEQVWDVLKRFGVVPPVPYRLGWGRSSCMKCIFNSATIWSTLYHYFPESLDRIAQYEDSFGTTIHRSKKNVIELAHTSAPLKITDKDALKQAMSDEYFLPVVESFDKWKLPAGAFNKTSCGPS